MRPASFRPWPVGRQFFNSDYMQWIDPGDAFGSAINNHHLAGRYRNKIGVRHTDSRPVAKPEHKRFWGAVEAVPN